MNHRIKIAVQILLCVLVRSLVRPVRDGYGDSDCDVAPYFLYFFFFLSSSHSQCTYTYLRCIKYMLYILAWVRVYLYISLFLMRSNQPCVMPMRIRSAWKELSITKTNGKKICGFDLIRSQIIIIIIISKWRKANKWRKSAEIKL